ncbi:MFS transporter [Streptomyces polygonati]|uniref:MFS transporter n=1 Tax=Streptomyces polygonati TaxID=1617087 RepID=A0ABV8HMU7_9ACTN
MKWAELSFLGVRGFSAAAYFLLVPFLALWLINSRGLSGEAAATVVALCLFSGRVGGMVAAPFLSRIDLHRSVVTAYIAATATASLMALYQGGNPVVWILLGSLLGLSFSSATAALKALVVVAYSSEQRLWAFSRLNLAVNAGAPAGIAAGGYLMAHSPGLFAWSAAGLYAAALILLKLVPKASERQDQSPSDAPAAGGRLAFGFFLFFTSITWVAYSQVFDVLPTFSADHVGTQSISYLFIVNSVMIIVLQTPITAAVEYLRKRGPGPAAGTILPGVHLALGISILMFGFTGHASMIVAYGAMTIFTLTELVWGPAYDSIVPRLKGRITPFAAYGIAGAVRGGAESLGSWVGIATATSAVVAWPSSALLFWVSAGGLVVVATYFLWVGTTERTMNARVEVPA